MNLTVQYYGHNYILLQFNEELTLGITLTVFLQWIFFIWLVISTTTTYIALFELWFYHCHCSSATWNSLRAYLFCKTSGSVLIDNGCLFYLHNNHHHFRSGVCTNVRNNKWTFECSSFAQSKIRYSKMTKVRLSLMFLTLVTLQCSFLGLSFYFEQCPFSEFARNMSIILYHS